jgi:hypothetical protein
MIYINNLIGKKSIDSISSSLRSSVDLFVEKPNSDRSSLILKEESNKKFADYVFEEIGNDGFSRIEQVISAISGCTVKKIKPEMMFLYCYKPGSFLGPHADSYGGFDGDFYSVVGYLNDDYVGGELCVYGFSTASVVMHDGIDGELPNYEPPPICSIKPEPGSVVIIKGSNFHHVNEVVDGNKFIFTILVPVIGCR